MNNQNTQLKQCIYIEKGIIPSNICDYIIDETEKREWSPHQWHSSQTNTFYSEETKELDVQQTNEELQSIINPFMIRAGAEYNHRFSFDIKGGGQIMNKFSKVRFNKYSGDQIMRMHYDHITSLFDGTNRGIPILSFIGGLNDDYTGGDLVFWNDYKISLGKGDIVMFPSLFLFPHGVEEVTSGVRRSFVSWAW